MQSIFQTIAEANRQIDLAQSVVSNNLANVGTTAFKADLYAAQVQYRGDANTDAGPLTIQPDATAIAVGTDGTISYAPPGNAGAARVTLGRIMLVNPNPETLVKGLDGEIRADANEDLVADAEIQVVSGALESSNVNPISAMVEMISLSRAFEAQSKTLKSADEMDESSASLMRVQAG